MSTAVVVSFAGPRVAFIPRKKRSMRPVWLLLIAICLSGTGTLNCGLSRAALADEPAAAPASAAPARRPAAPLRRCRPLRHPLLRLPLPPRLRLQHLPRPSLPRHRPKQTSFSSATCGRCWPRIAASATARRSRRPVCGSIAGRLSSKEPTRAPSWWRAIRRRAS